MNEVLNNRNQTGKIDNKKAFLTLAYFAYFILFVLLFIPYFSYPTTISLESLTSIDVFLGIDYGKSLVVGIQELSIVLLMVLLIVLIVATVFIKKATEGFKNDDISLVIYTNKMLSYAGWICALFFLSAFYIVEICNKSGSGLEHGNSYWLFLVVSVLRIILSVNVKKLKKAKGENCLLSEKNWTLRIAIAIGATLILFCVTIGITANSYSDQGIASLVSLGVVFVGIANVFSLRNEMEEYQRVELKKKEEERRRVENININAVNRIEYHWNVKNLNRINESVGICNKLSMREYAQKLYTKINAMGISISEEEVGNVLSAMASSKVVLLNVNNPETSRNFAKILSDSFSYELFIENYFQTSLDNPALNSQQENMNKKHSVESGLYVACHLNNFISMIFFDEFKDSTKAERFFESVAFGEERIHVGELGYLEKSDYYSQNKMPIPDNLWIIGFVDDDCLQYLTTEEWIKYSTVVELDLSEKEVEENDEDFNIQYPPFVQEIEESQESFYLSENNWKKFDKLEEYLIKTVGFGYENRFLRQLEKFASTYLSIGGSQEQVVDAILSMRVMPWLATKKELLTSETVGDFALSVDEIFGNENIPNTIKIMSRFELKK